MTKHTENEGAMQIATKVLNLINSRRPRPQTEPIAPTTTFHDLELDHLDLTEIAMDLEEEFDCSIPDSDIDNLPDIASLIDYIRNKLRLKQES